MQAFTVLALVASVVAAPPPHAKEQVNAKTVRQTGPIVSISYPQAAIVGSTLAGIDTFNAIPFAKPPVGQLRLKPPQPITSPLGTVVATGRAPACAQQKAATPNGLPSIALTLPLLSSIDGQEDCLTLNINRPAGTKAGAKLPVLFWIYGGGFEAGSSSMYDGSGIVRDSVNLSKEPIIYVAVNYRLSAFGFLGGKELLKEGSTNLGLLDQRLGLQWVADNIAAFGGDPTKVTIWGESAGAISVWDQMALYDGNNKYKGKPLFRGGIMNSGSIVPAQPVDSKKAQLVFDQVASVAGCGNAANKPDCLRNVPYDVFYNASNSLPSIFTYNSVALAYLPRPDGKTLTASPDILAEKGKYAKVPFIVGDQEDEGTLFSLTQSNITTTENLRQYLQDIFFPDASPAAIQTLLDAYPDDPSQGSPFGTGILYNIYPQFKRIAALLGDLTFTLTRRGFLNAAQKAHPDVKFWSYLSSYFKGTPVLGTFHGSDILQVFNNIPPTYPGFAFRSYYISFINHLDPNAKTTFPYWPEWKDSGKQLVHMNALNQDLITDDFRSRAFNLVFPNAKQYYI